jgi:hypothetical protein
MGDFRFGLLSLAGNPPIKPSDFRFWILDWGELGIAPHPLTSSLLHLPCPSAPLSGASVSTRQFHLSFPANSFVNVEQVIGLEARDNVA